MIALLWDNAEMELAACLAFYNQHGADIGIADDYMVLCTSFRENVDHPLSVTVRDVAAVDAVLVTFNP